MSRSSLGTSLVLGLLASTSLAACSGDDAPSSNVCDLPGAESSDAAWADVVTDAKKEGAVTLYTARQPANAERLIDAFEKVCPAIQVEYVRSGSADLIAKADAERESGAAGADVVMVSELGWFAEHAESGDLLDLGPDAGTPAWEKDRFETWATVSIDPLVLGINTQRAESVDSYDDLIGDDDLQGSVGLLDVSLATATTQMYMHLQEEFGGEFMADLADQKPNVFPSATPMAQSLASGENAVVFALPPSAIEALKANGAPVDYVIPEQGYMGYKYGLGAVAWGEHPNAARVLTNFIMTEQGQRAVNGDGASVSPLADVEGSLPLEGMFILNPLEAEPSAIEDYRASWSDVMGRN